LKISHRPGFTLIELVAVLGITALVAVLISTTLSRQQRLYRRVSETLDVHRGVRDGVAVLAEELRGASAADTVRLMSDSAIELFTSLGFSLSCGSVSPGDVALAPNTASGIPLTTWLAVPDTGDLALVYTNASSTAGTWQRYRIRSVSSRSSSTACPAGSPFGGSGTSYVVTLLQAPAAIVAGEPVRFIRRGRYSLYKSSDGKWYLGYRRCNALGPSTCGSVQPVSGYYQPYSADTARTGLLFRYFDNANQQLPASASGLRVARVEISARAVSSNSVNIDGSNVTARDSAAVSVALRNHP
jgi:prepilin-type N-terminal cleavage/methylation domain-containing protein